jgi:glycerophosphoryl diester phosphodiesterase
LPHSSIAFPLGLQGHRGARGLFPENTIEGFRAALALGIDAIEFDVGMTADGVPVVSHDLLLNPDIVRDAGGNWLTQPGLALRDLTLQALSAFDVGRLRPGSVYAAQFPLQQPFDGARIPTLHDVLRVGGATRFTVELKTDPRFPHRTVPPAELADATLAVVDAAGAASRIDLESFDWRGPRHVHRTRPDIRLAWLTRPETVRNAHLWWDGPVPSDYGGSVPRAVAAEGGGIWAPEHGDLTLDLVAEAHDLGLLVLPWTVNDTTTMRRLIGWGVDGLITDRPDLMQR